MTISQAIKYIGLQVNNQFHMEKTESALANLFVDEITKHVLYIDSPIQSTIDTTGPYQQQTYDVRIMFLIKSEVDWTWEQHDGFCLLYTNQYCKDFVKKCLEIDPDITGITKIENARNLEVINLFDVNCSGHYLTCRITLKNLPNCQ
jgi:hypothetical protein